MRKSRNPNGVGSYKLRKDGRHVWTQMVDGKPRTLYGKTLSELQAKVNKVRDLPVTSNKLTVCDWFEKWLEVYIKQLKKKATYDQYRILYEQHIKPVIGHRKLTGVKTIDIQSVIAKMNEKKKASKTMAEFTQLKDGMTYEEATAIIGGPGEVLSESGSPGEALHTIMYSYKGESGLGANANIMFQGNKLNNKAQFGLK